MTNGGEKHEQRRPASSPSNTGRADADANLEATENNGTDASNAAADDQQNPPQPSRPTIRFALSSSTRHIPSLHDLDDDVLQALYYDEDENGDMLLDVVRNITAMRRHLQEQQPQAPQQQGNNNGLNIGALDANSPVEGEEEDEEMQEEEEEYCFRGLEHVRDNTVMQMRQQARDQVIDNVLEEQERQRANEDDGVAPLSPERLAAVSRASSTSARNRGIIMGILDEAAVRRDRHAEGDEEGGPPQQGQPRQEGAGDADNPDNSNSNRRNEDEEDGDGGGSGGGNGRETLVGLLGAAGRMGLK